jgi:Tol biopolymer transport system component
VKRRFSATGLTCAVASSLLVVAASADATFAGRNGRLVYARGSSGLYTSRPDGSRRRRLVRAEAADPVWGPDGRRVAFVGKPPRDRPGSEIYVVDSRTRHARALARVRGIASSPSWSRDGTRLAFLRLFPQSNRAELWITRVRDGAKHKTADGFGGVGDAEWSPTAGEIAYTGPDGDLYVSDPSGGEVRRLVDEPEGAAVGEISWSPGGRWLAFMEYRLGPCEACSSLARVRSSGGPARQLEARRFQTSSRDPVWAPRGGTIRYCRERGERDRFPSYVASTMRADGSGIRTFPRASCHAGWQARGR